jgi:uncharacterized protein YhjY with autotransporter beta-barrel domain
MYFMRAYVESLLGYTKQTEKSQLALAGWELDSNLDEINSSHGVISTAVSTTLILKNKGAKLHRYLITTYQKSNPAFR